jgi:SPP1 gp7 family putative phage head morphogenesis protein
VALSALFGLGPEQAVRYLEAKGYRLTWNWWEMQREAHARAFTVAKLARLDILQDIRAAVETALKEGKTERWFRQELEDTLKKKGWWGKQVDVDPVTGEAQLYQAGSRRRLQTIYRTNLQTAYMAGRQKQFDKEKDRAPFVQYLAVLDQVTRPAHAALHGKVFRLDDPAVDLIFPPNGFNCFPAETSVAGRFQLGLKTWYAGPMVEIETSGGNRLTVTANHPILTRRGWLRAEQIKETDDLLRHQAGVNSAASGIVDDQQPPASAEQRFESLAAHGLAVVPMAPLDFHGDAHRRKGEIHIAGSDRILMDRMLADVAQGVENRDLVRADDGRLVALETLGAPECQAVPVQAVGMQNAIDVASTVTQAPGNGAHGQQCVAVERHHLGLEDVVVRPARLPGGPDLSSESFGVGLDLRPLQALGLAAPSRVDVAEPQDARDSIAGASVLFGKLIDAFPALVATDQVLRIRKYVWSGHVYDFQTETGLIVAGGLIVHNCRCRMRNLSQRELDARGLKVQTDTQVHSRKPKGKRPMDPRTGETPGNWTQRGVSIPDPANPKQRLYLWPDVGWDYNPGRASVANTASIAVKKLAEAPADLAKPVVQSLVLGVLAQWLASPQGAFPLAIISEADAGLIGAKARLAVLSEETAAKQAARHPELTPAEYQHVQTCVDRGERIQDGAHSLIYLLEAEGYVTVVKATKTGAGLFVTSFRRLSESQAKRDSEIRRLRGKGA